MHATTERRRRALVLKKDEFDELTRATFGEISKRELAERLGMNETNLSLIRNRRCGIGATFIARFMAQWPHRDIKEFAEEGEIEEASDGR